MEQELILNRIKSVFLIICIACVAISCGEEKKQKPKNKTASFIKAKMPQVSADSVFSFVQKQVDFGPRTPNSEGHEQCASWLVKSFKRFGLTVKEQKDVQVAHDGKKLNFTNIIAQYAPEKKKRILLTAHWDTRPWADQDVENQDKPIDGANDAGSGVAVILEIARLLNQMEPNVGVDMVLFDIEDYGQSNGTFCYGSQYWMHKTELEDNLPMYGINLDMVGDPNAVFPYEGYSQQFARPILDKVWRVGQNMGHGRYFKAIQDGQITDDHLYVNQAGIPCIDIIHRDPSGSGFAHSWHTHQDDMSNISKNTLEAVTETVLQTIYREK
jgi:Zn-dependent M28 family amino/carboxypeptidase